MVRRRSFRIRQRRVAAEETLREFRRTQAFGEDLPADDFRPGVPLFPTATLPVKRSSSEPPGHFDSRNQGDLYIVMILKKICLNLKRKQMNIKNKS